MNHSEIAGLVNALAPVIGDFVGKAMAPLRAENTALKGRLETLETGFKSMPTRDDNAVVILRLVEETVAKTVKAPDPDIIAGMVDKAVAAIEIPAGKDGEPGASVTIEQLDPIIEQVVARHILALPTRSGKDGEPGRDGEKGDAGLSITIEDMMPLVEDVVGKTIAGLPAPIAGKDGEPGRDGEKGEPGESIVIADIEPVIDQIVAKRIEALPAPVAGKEGAPGRDGRDGLPGVQGERGSNGKNGVDGRDGLGIDDLDVTSSDDGRLIVLSLKAKDCEPIVRRIPTAIVLDRGVWREQAYAKGDGVTWAGSFFIAQRATEPNEKPGEAPEAFRLAVKRGRDGRDGKNGSNGINGKDGATGRDGRNNGF